MPTTAPRGAVTTSGTTLLAERSLGGAVAWAASRAEQEIRARPRAHRAFYVAVTRVPAVRDLAGRLKDRVRGRGAEAVTPPPALEDDAVRLRHDAAVAARLGFRSSQL